MIDNVWHDHGDDADIKANVEQVVKNSDNERGLQEAWLAGLVPMP